MTFYARHDARALDLPYFQPSLGPCLDRERGMLLVVLSCTAACVDEHSERFVRVDWLRAFIDEYLAVSDDGELGDDAAGRAVAQALRAPVALVPLEDYRSIPSS